MDKKKSMIIDEVRFTNNLNIVMELWGEHFRLRISQAGDWDSIMFLHSYEEFKSLLNTLQELDKQIAEEDGRWHA